MTTAIITAQIATNKMEFNTNIEFLFMAIDAGH